MCWVLLSAANKVFSASHGFTNKSLHTHHVMLAFHWAEKFYATKLHMRSKSSSSSNKVVFGVITGLVGMKHSGNVVHYPGKF
jgi:hypothetical protein